MFADTLLNIGRTSIFDESALSATNIVDDEIEAITPDSVGECAGDPFEFLVGVAYESQMDMVNINQSIMVCEYTYLKETGEEMIYEDNVVKSVFSHVGNAIVNAWKKICSAFASIKKWIQTTLASDKKIVEKYGSYLDNNNIGNIPVSFTGYSYFKKSGEYATANDITSMVKAMIGSISDSAKCDKITSESNAETICNEIRGAVVGKDSVAAADFAKELDAHVKGEKTTFENIKHAQVLTAIGVVKTAKDTSKAVDEAFKAAKKTITELKASAKKAEAEADKANKQNASEEAAKAAKAAHTKATVIIQCLTILSSTNSHVLKAICAHNRQCKAIVLAAVAATKKAQKDSKKANTDEKEKADTKATGESAVFASDTDSAVKSIFDSLCN